MGQYLNWQHGKEGEEQGGDNHRYHISEIAGSRHFNVFDDIPKGPPAGHHAFLQYHQVFLQQDNIRGFLRNIYSGVHGNTYVRLVKRRGIINSVPHITDRVSIGLKRFHYPLFLGRGQLRKNTAAFHRL